SLSMAHRQPTGPAPSSHRFFLLAAATGAAEPSRAHRRARARSRRRGGDTPGEFGRIPVPRRGAALSANQRRSSMNVCGKEIRIRGRLVRIARLAAEGYEFVDDPAAAIADLKAQRGLVDLFTFTQEPPDAAPKYDFCTEWDNVAAIPISTFEHW